MGNRSRILFVIANYPPRPGGAERHTERLCATLHAKRHRVRILTIRYPESSRTIQPQQAPICYFPTPSAERWRDLCFALWVAASLPFLRLRYDQVQWIMPGLQVLVGLPISAALGMKNSLYFAGSGEAERLQYSQRGRWLLWLAKRLVDRVIVLNSAMMKEVQELGFDRARLIRLSCEADPQRFRPPRNEERELARMHWGIPQDRKVIVFVGRLVQGKGLPALLEAFTSLRILEPKTSLLIVGDGPLLNDLRARAAAHGLGNSVIFTGQLADDAVAEALRCSDIFTLPSRAEGIPVALLEAMATGLPSVVSDIAGTEIVVHGVHGLRVVLENGACLADALNRLIADRDLRIHMGGAALEAYRSTFTPDRVAQSYEVMYGNIRQKDVKDAVASLPAA